MKKSRSGLTLAEICKRYAEDAMATPAKNAPMAIEKPAIAPTADNKKAQAIAATNNNSVEVEVNLNKMGKMNFEAKYVNPTKSNPLTKIKRIENIEGRWPP